MPRIVYRFLTIPPYLTVIYIYFRVLIPKHCTNHRCPFFPVIIITVWTYGLGYRYAAFGDLCDLAMLCGSFYLPPQRITTALPCYYYRLCCYSCVYLFAVPGVTLPAVLPIGRALLPHSTTGLDAVHYRSHCLRFYCGALYWTFDRRGWFLLTFFTPSYTTFWLV